jgi:hypothetical protein
MVVIAEIRTALTAAPEVGNLTTATEWRRP